MCKWAGVTTKPTAELIAAAKASAETLRNVSHNCPACILTAIRLGNNDPFYSSDERFQFKKETDSFWNRLRDKWEHETEADTICGGVQ